MDPDRFIIKLVPPRADFERFREETAKSALAALLSDRGLTLVRIMVRPPHFVRLEVAGEQEPSRSADLLAEIPRLLGLTGPVEEYVEERGVADTAASKPLRAAPPSSSVCDECGFLDGEHLSRCSKAR